jgi:hypothetical protein
MVYHLKVVESSARRVSLELAEPPCPSHLVKPPLLPDQEGGVTVSDGIVSSSSGDGFLLLQFVDAHVKTDEAAMLRCGVAPSRVLIDAFMNSDCATAAVRRPRSLHLCRSDVMGRRGLGRRLRRPVQRST